MSRAPDIRDNGLDSVLDAVNDVLTVRMTNTLRPVIPDGAWERE